MACVRRHIVGIRGSNCKRSQWLPVAFGCRENKFTVCRSYFIFHGTINRHNAERWFVCVSGKIFLHVHNNALAPFQEEMRLCHPVEIVLKISISVAVSVFVRIAHSISLLPPVGHTILISIPVGIASSLIDVQSAEALTAGILLAVDESFLSASAPFGGIRTLYSFAYHPLVVIVEERLVGTNIREHVLVCRPCCFHRGERLEERLIHKRSPVEFLSAGEGILVCRSFLVFLNGAVVFSLSDISADVCTLRPRARTFKLQVQKRRLRCGWSHFVVVAHEIYLVRTAVGGTRAPVVYHVVEHVVMPVVSPHPVESAAKAPVSAVVVGKQVVVVRTHLQF